jgi:hypothetical protein
MVSSMETPATSATMPKYTNRLAEATSPYLLQHAHNPVERYEWGPEVPMAFSVLFRPLSPAHPVTFGHLHQQVLFLFRSTNQ